MMFSKPKWLTASMGERRSDFKQRCRKLWLFSRRPAILRIVARPIHLEYVRVSILLFLRPASALEDKEAGACIALVRSCTTKCPCCCRSSLPGVMTVHSVWLSVKKRTWKDQRSRVLGASCACLSHISVFGQVTGVANDMHRPIKKMVWKCVRTFWMDLSSTLLIPTTVSPCHMCACVPARA